MKKKIFFVNNKFYLLDEFINIFLKSYNPFDKIKEYFKPQNNLELVIVNDALKTKLISN
ncbi:MAG: hypothetical protein Q8S84_06010 [bacterium]|nr:hypothetical protein [bacterium]MDP3381034.1 hypothetical protein [bacterium]